MSTSRTIPDGPVFTMQHGTDFANKCKHFNGVKFTDPAHRCRVGVLMCEATVSVGFRYRYGDGGTVYTSNHSLPCIGGHDPKGVCNCAAKELPTAEEVAEDEAWIAQRIAMIHASGPLIESVKRDHAGESWQGVEKCPVCGGKLHMSHAALNGHVWGRCETEDCLSWME